MKALQHEHEHEHEQLQELHNNDDDEEEEDELRANPFSRKAYVHELQMIWQMAWKVSLATFCRLGLPTICTAFLGHLGSNALAGAALAQIWTSGVQMMIWGFATSLCTLCGQAYGAKNMELVGIWLQLGICFLTLFSIPVMVSYFYVEQILSFATDDQAVLRLAGSFARWTAASVWPAAIYGALRQYLQAQEIVSPAMMVSVLSVGVCLVSNYVLIYGLGPIPALHFVGAALAQNVASWFQLLALWWYACRYKRYHEETWYGWTWDALQWDRVKRFMTLSMGMTLNLGIDEWIYNVLCSIACTMGPVNLAANSVLFNLWDLVFGIFWGFGLPTQVRTANFLGGNEPAQAQRSMHVGFFLGSLSAAAAALCVLMCRGTIIGFFTSDPMVVLTIEQSLPLFCLAVFVSGLHVILAAVVEAMSLAATLVVITTSGSWLVMLPSSYLFGVQWHFGLPGLWWGSVLGEATKFLLMALVLVRINWREMALLAVRQSEGDLEDTELQEEATLRASMLAPGNTKITSPIWATTYTPRHGKRGRFSSSFSMDSPLMLDSLFDGHYQHPYPRHHHHHNHHHHHHHHTHEATRPLLNKGEIEALEHHHHDDADPFTPTNTPPAVPLYGAVGTESNLS